MTSWIKKLLGLNGHDEINQEREALFVEKKQAINDLKRINKRFKFIIESKNIDLVIREIEDVRIGK
jgi:hypothetical protein